MINSVEQNDQPLSAYLLKLLTIIVKRQGGELRIPLTDLLGDLQGEGLVKHQEPQELVLRYASKGSSCYFITGESGGQQWQGNGKKASSTPAPQRLESNQTDPSHLILDDSRLVDLEEQRRRAAAEKLLMNFPSPPQTRPQQRSQNLRDSYSKP